MKLFLKRIFNLKYLIALLLIPEGCIVPFSPPEVSLDEQYLVVDGFFNVGGNDSSRIELRRTQNVNQTDQPLIETGAAIAVEAEKGRTYTFVESGAGTYFLPPGSYDMQDKYRIRIKTANGQEYLSDFVTVSRTPAIDSLAYKLDNVQNAMIFYVNAHDEQNKTQFYRWKFEETWEYESTYSSALEVVDSQVVSRKENITKCWQNKKSGSILLGSTVRLSNDIIKDLPLNTVPVSTNKLFRKYSILVTQYGLSRAAFEYWTELSKSTQLTGSLFDPQPAQVTGNIKNIADPKSLVFGYFSASTEETRRITISPNLGIFPRCTEPDTIPVQCSGFPDDPCAFNTQKLLLTYWGPRSDSVLVASPDCADCRTSGGTTRKPSFW
ncbi:DUF4249 domain-containing protein [Dyadobacter chenwenxiniae]|uniref:DUF4249 domain-containing protein n=1 Tax=Dyadobacter chenwenxiniae TaxID=2906456 RepID=A0A9X1TP78_9BACT|nr:DUF4249 domain-containing protein [Dyadobacter chenwenxiniae]MCF0065278.1 DUF4249 domain-containing protein [Dyadobacter chenwenxiniae]UON84454.1 DUF4249 domain-containing protein [Dyadobacter chenwenxiniae]